MKIMKNLLFTITLLVSASAFAMEAPPQAPVKVAVTRPLLPLKGLPADIQRKLFPLCMEGNLYDIAETILAFAGTNKENQAYVNDNMIVILESFPYTAKAIEIYKLLENKTVSLSVMQKPHMKIWLKDAQNSLSDGPALYAAIVDENPESIATMKKLLLIKTIDLNSKQRADTCLSFAASRGQKEKVASLLEAGANSRIKGYNHNCPGCICNDAPLVCVVSANNNEYAEIVTILLKFGANPNISFMKRGLMAASFPHHIGTSEIIALIKKAQKQKKQKLEERRRKLYASKIESTQQKTADGCAIA